MKIRLLLTLCILMLASCETEEFPAPSDGGSRTNYRVDTQQDSTSIIAIRRP